MPTFAAVDIGSNSCRLKIAKVIHGRLQTLHEDREVTRLGEGVFANGTLDPESMALTIRVLKRFHRAIQDHAADRIRVVATAALRDARNIRAVDLETGQQSPQPVAVQEQTRGMVFFPDSRHFATFGNQSQVHLWNVRKP